MAILRSHGASRRDFAPKRPLRRMAAGMAVLAVMACAPAVAQPRAHGIKAASLSSLTAQGFEIKAALRDALIVQKGAAIYSCILHLANTSPLSYQSECYAVR